MVGYFVELDHFNAGLLRIFSLRLQFMQDGEVLSQGVGDGGSTAVFKRLVRERARGARRKKHHRPRS